MTTAQARYRHSPKGRAATRIRDSRFQRNLRITVIGHYSQGLWKCACCGESHIEFLSIDHVNGGGNKHRREIGIHCGGKPFYQWLKRSGYPSGYRVLCHNCNFASGHGGCPHTKSGVDKSGVDITKNQVENKHMDQKFLDGADYGIKGYAEKNSGNAPGLNSPAGGTADLTKGCRLSGCGGSEQSIDSVQASSDVLKLISKGPGLDLSQESKRIDSPGATAKN
jgi:hypothetical protein